ncbi:MAG: PAS domain S-box protein [Chloroflexi bacterium]|nr:PAS domain S-box protein [Chloroflexota bacterium]
MKIDTKLKLAVLVPVSMALVIGLAFFLSYTKVIEAQEKDRTSQRILFATSEINSLVSSYVLNPEERLKQQFLLQHDSVMQRLTTFPSRNAEQRQAVNSIRNHFESQKELFLELASIYEQPDSQRDAALFREAVSQLTGQISLRSRYTLSDVSRLESLVDAEMVTTQGIINALIFLFIVVVSVFFTLLLHSLIRYLSTSLASLRRETEIIASGDFDHRVGVTTGDELGELARAFDRMAEQLKGITVSKNVLQQEIVERRKAELALQKAYRELVTNEERLKRSQEIAHLGSWELDLVNNTLFWSDEVYRIFGLEPQEFGATYEAFLDAVHPDDRAAVDAAYSSSIRDGRDSYEIEHRVIRKSTGEMRYVHERCQHVRDESGKIIRSVGMVHDVTERKKAEEALRERESELSAILSSIPVLTLVVDADLRLLGANSAAVRFAGRSPEELISLPAGNALSCLNSVAGPRGCGSSPACQICKARLAMLDTLKTGNSHYNVEWQLSFLREGKQQEVVLLLSTVLLNTGRKRVLVCLEDITERKKAERLKDEFIGMVSHELRTPLTVVIGALSVATAEGLPQEQSRELIRDAATYADVLAGIVDNLLELSRHQSDRLAIQTERSDIGQIARDVIQRLQTRSDTHHLVVDIPSDAPAIFVDRVRIELVLHNLVENAIKYSPKGGEVRVLARQQDSQLVVSVSDHGVGISPEDQLKLFQSFERVQVYKKHLIPGLGLGLRVCRILVEAHGGQIWVESAPGKGTTFFFTVPLGNAVGQVKS